MKLCNIKAVIFDLEGTLLTSKIDFAKMRKKMTEVLVFHGFKAETFPFMLVTNVNKLKSALREKGVSELKISEINEEINNAINDVEMENIDETVEIFGATKTLQELKARNIKIGVVTRNGRESAIVALKITGLMKFVDVLVTRDDCDNPKPEPEHLLKALRTLKMNNDEALMVGDSWPDIQCAVNAKVKFMGVLTGYSTREKFREMGVDFLPSVKYLIHFLKY